MNASTRAVITPISGGIVTVKNGWGAAVSSTPHRDDPASIIDGNSAAPVKYDMNPASNVEPYAIMTVMISILPADLPMSAIAGVTSPTMIRGIANPRNWLKIPLNVRNNLTAHSGTISPAMIPDAMAIRILPNRPIFSLFIIWRLCI